MSAGQCVPYVSLPIFRQWTKYAFLELKDPSQVEWVLGLHNTPIPNCPSKVSCLSCDFYRLSCDLYRLSCDLYRLSCDV